MAPLEGTIANFVGTGSAGDVVEIGLLLPASWAADLLQMSKRRHQSVGQLLRSIIDRELVADTQLGS